jgi:hypothetical protein
MKPRAVFSRVPALTVEVKSQALKVPDNPALVAND